LSAWPISFFAYRLYGYVIYLGEDCLYLNVWRADDAATTKKPVMVWIYGGAFETGGTADPNYECHNFVEENLNNIKENVAKRCAAYSLNNK
jgi:para-nitrobenzyl esterase